MKVVKLKKNQKLFKDGFTHAFRFDTQIGQMRWAAESGDENRLIAVVDSLKKIYNGRRWRGQYYAWEHEYGGWRKTKNNAWGWNRYQYVAVRSEHVVTQVLLIM
jgi:hypothetical protein